jgi:peptidoglycan hydrolase-like protein with peptidoglycan-binding domain
MSRSHRALAEPSTLATAVCGASRGTRLVHRGRLEHSGLGVPRPSKRRLLRIAIAIVPLATAHAALASSIRHAPSTHHNSTIQRTAAPRNTRANGAHRFTAARVRLLQEMRRDNNVVLSRGSGYGTAAGSPLVRALQIQLSRGGYRPGPIDGLYGPRTRASVSAFQGAYGLAVDGVAGPRTLREMTARTPALYPGAGRGVGGATPVRGLQRRLARAGYSPGPIDGIFGPATERAVRRYQAAHGLPANGVAGPRTIARLHPRPAVRPPRRRTARPKSSRPRTHPRHRTSVPRRTSHPSAVGQPRSRTVTGTSNGWELPAGIAAGGLLLLAGAWYLRRRRGEPPHAVPTKARLAAPAEATATAIAAHPDAGSPPPETHQPTPTASRGLTEPEGAPPMRVEDEFERAGERAEAVIAFNTAVSLEHQDDRAGARAAYVRAERAGHAGAATNLGVMMELDGDVEGARAAYARADRRGDPNGTFNLGCLLDEQGDVAGALNAYERADQRGHAEAATNLGVLMEVSGNIANARAAYERAEQRGDPNGAANLGALLEELGERGAAKAAYRRAKRMRMAPGNGATRVRSHEPDPGEEPSPTYVHRGEGA